MIKVYDEVQGLIVFFWSLHMHFANVIVDSKWQANIHGAEKHEAWKDWEGGGFSTNGFKSWLMVYTYQPHFFLKLLCSKWVCNHISKLWLQGWSGQHNNNIRRQQCCVKKVWLLLIPFGQNKQTMASMTMIGKLSGK
jgi:hypothetical protein